MSRLRLLAGLAASAAMIMTAGLTAPASATTSQAANAARTRVVVAPPVAKLLASAHITPSTVGAASAFAFHGTLAVRFPITGTNPAGDVIRHAGGLRLTSSSASIVLSRFRIDLDAGRVSALVNSGARVNVFILGVHPNPALGDVRLKLTGPAARALNTTFGVKAFPKGATFGFASVLGT